MAASVDITLGDKTFTVKPLTFDVLQGVLELLPETLKPLSSGGFAARRKIIELALADQISAAELGQIGVTMVEISTASDQIAVVSGLVELGKQIAGMATH